MGLGMTGREASQRNTCNEIQNMMKNSGCILSAFATDSNVSFYVPSSR